MDAHSFELLDPDLDLHTNCGSGSASRREKMFNKNFKKPNFLFGGMNVYPVASPSIMEAYGL
jgi:hypothetical protein